MEGSGSRRCQDAFTRSVTVTAGFATTVLSTYLPPVVTARRMRMLFGRMQKYPPFKHSALVVFPFRKRQRMRWRSSAQSNSCNSMMLSGIVRDDRDGANRMGHRDKRLSALAQQLRDGREWSPTRGRSASG
ncbi:hypothetical protein C8R43DRAFT_964476 [Mycena crocata]|nr:hypothetical protein C8R43DRAFT_964476 [Mycena crocata]